MRGKKVITSYEPDCRAPFFKKSGGRIVLAVISTFLVTLFLLPVFSGTVISASSPSASSSSVSSSNTSSSSSQLFCDDPTYCAETDEIIAARDKVLANYYAGMRRLYGLHDAVQSEVLREAALYAAMLELCNGSENADAPENNSIASFFSELSGIDNYAFLLYSDYTCIDAERNAKMILNTLVNSKSGSEVLISPETSVFGVASALRQTEGGCKYCIVICASSRLTKFDENNLNDLLKDSLLKESPIKDSTQVPADSLIVAGRDIEYYSSGIDSKDAGTVSDTIDLPTIPAGDIWNVAYYINSGNIGQQSFLLCSPAVIGIDDLTDPRAVRVITKNGSGSILQESLTATSRGTNYLQIRSVYTDNKGLNVHIEEGTELTEGGHAIIAWTGTGDSEPFDGTGDRAANLFLFTVELSDGTRHTVRRGVPYTVWNPETEGIITIKAACYGADGQQEETSEIRIDVAKKNEVTHSEAELSIISGDLRIEEANDGTTLIRGIHAGTDETAVRDMFEISGGEAPELTITKADGTQIDEGKPVGTGTVIRLTDGGKVYSELVVIIAGDVNGDGAVGIADFAKLRQHLLKGGVVTDVFAYAADLNGDDSIGIADFAKLRQHLLGALELD